MTKEQDRRPRLSTLEVSEMFGVSRGTLNRWVKEGIVPEPARDPESGWPIWQQPELDAIAKAAKNRRKKK